MGKVGHLSELHDKYYDRGFRVVAISEEPRKLLEKEMVRERKATYWIGVDEKDVTSPNFSHDEQSGIPRFYLVDARGRVIGHDIPTEEELEALLAEAYDVELGRKLHAKLATAQVHYESGAYGAAWKAAKKVLADKKADEQATIDAKFLCEKIEAYSTFAQDTAVWRMENLDPPDAYGMLLELRHEFAGLPAAKWADKQARPLKKDPKVKRDRDAWRKYEAALKRELKARGRAYDLDRAKQSYEEIIKKYPRAAATRFAVERIEEHLSKNK